MVSVSWFSLIWFVLYAFLFYFLLNQGLFYITQVGLELLILQTVS